jgi:hypothetical protein
MSAADEVNQANEEQQQDESHERDDQDDLISQSPSAFWYLALRHRDP